MQLRDRIKELRRVPASELRPNPKNWRTHPEAQQNALRGVLAEIGIANAVLVRELADGSLMLIDGHLRAETLGAETVPVLVLDVDEAEADKLLVTLDPLAAMAEADKEQLKKLLKSVETQNEAVKEMLDSLVYELPEIESQQIEIIEDDVLNVSDELITKPGDLWLLGDHRLLCGDSTKAEDVERLMAETKINIAFTSPPYASQRKYDESSGFKPIHPDHYVSWWNDIQINVAKHLAIDGSFFVNIKEHCEDGQRHLYVKDLVIAHVRQWEWLFVDEFCWTHGGTPKAVVNRFKNGWEPIFQFTKSHAKTKNAKDVSKSTNNPFVLQDGRKSGSPNDEGYQSHKFRPKNVTHKSDAVIDWNGKHPSQNDGQGLRVKGEGMNNMQGHGDAIGATAVGAVTTGLAYPSNVLSVGKNREALGHGAAFPVALPAFFIKAYTDFFDIVYEPFCGSGSTLIAAEQLRRKCYGMEISPKYCDVIIRRWENLTGQKAVLENG